MSNTIFLVVVIFVTMFAVKLCETIDLGDNKNTNTVVYLIGYAVGCIIMTINFYFVK